MCANRELLQGTLRDQLGFQGAVVTDCNALEWMAVQPPTSRGYAQNLRNASALALAAGTDMTCKTPRLKAPLNGTELEADLPADVIDRAARHVLQLRVRMGHLNPPNNQPWNGLQPSEIHSPAHLNTARVLAGKSIVLLKNSQGMLPLNATALSSVGLFGPFAADPLAILGNYFTPPPGGATTFLGAMQAALGSGATVTFNSSTAAHCTPANINADVARCQTSRRCTCAMSPAPALHQLLPLRCHALRLQVSDVCILFLGTNMVGATNAGDTTLCAPAQEGEVLDRVTLKLNANQLSLFQALANRTTKPLNVVLVHGGPVDVSELHDSPRVGAMLTTWLPGEGAAAVADVLLGKVAPSGHLPVTWYKEAFVEAVSMLDMRMRASAGFPGRSHRFYRGPAPLYSFGYGLSFTNFSANLSSFSVAPGSGLTVNVTVKNTGAVAAEHVVLALVSYVGPPAPAGAGAPPRAKILRSGCDPTARRADMVQALAGYQRSPLLGPGVSGLLRLWLPVTGGSTSAWAGFGNPQPPCGLYRLRLNTGLPAAMEVVLAV
ncbi:hypothetical protein ABPG75_001157 [Micractinium tetrahymenae]